MMFAMRAVSAAAVIAVILSLQGCEDDKSDNDFVASESDPQKTQSAGAGTPPCLCVFDIDRTLTGKQGDTTRCPRNRELPGVHDNGYGSGNLTLSALAAVGINRTFCGGCYLGICSAGDADGDGSDERDVLVNDVLRSTPFDELRQTVPSASTWSHYQNVTSPLVLRSPNKQKQFSVEDIRKWYLKQGICISSANVYFFGDRTENMAPFAEMDFNAREISCGSRDPDLYDGSGMVGYCGARPDELVQERGIAQC